MKYQHVISIIPELSLKRVEKALMKIGVPAVNVSRVKGYGDYKNHFKKDCMDSCMRMELFCETENLDDITTAITHAAHGGLTSDGLIAITPVDTLINIKDIDEEKL